MTVTIRRLEAGEDLAALNTFRAALLVPALGVGPYFTPWEDGRAFVATSGAQIVGTAGQFSLQTTVPGGARVPTAGVTRVGVRADHSGRGVGRRLMIELLHEARDRGDLLANLRASEATIYGRYGYGVAGQSAAFELLTSSARFVHAVDDPGTIQLVHAEDAPGLLPDLHDRVGRSRPGAIDRPAWMWPRIFQPGEGEPGIWYGVHYRADGQPDGYATYCAIDRDRWLERGHKIDVLDLFAADDVVAAALWKWLLRIPLVQRVKAEDRPLDEPLRWLLADSRALRTTAIYDEQWLRLLDVEGALRARRWPPGLPPLVVDVHDHLIGSNSGRYVIQDGTTSRDDRAAPDLAVDVATLAATYLGGPSWAEMAAAGRVEVPRAGAVAAADHLFAVRPLPWSGTMF